MTAGGRRLVAFVAAWVVATAVCLAWIDGPASTFAYEHHLRAHPVFPALTHLVDPLQALAAIGLALAAIARIGWNWRPGPKGRTFLAACLTLIVAYGIKEMLKTAFGRPWPETWIPHSPSWISSHDARFHFFHGGQGYASFPSGHTTQMASIAGVLWQRTRLWRWLGAALTLAVMVGLWASDYHYVGDTVAGAFLGVGTGYAVLAFLREE